MQKNGAWTEASLEYRVDKENYFKSKHFMKGITKEYLLYVINDCIKITIHYRRKTADSYFAKEITDVTEEELIDFITAIPYFSNDLKDFLLGHLAVRSIIISQEWEKDFARKSVAFATDPKWTETDMSFLAESFKNVVITDALEMPY
ncbi:hypothetical protein [Ferruginibacter sp.]